MAAHDDNIALTIKLPKRLVNALDKLAEIKKTSKQSLITEAILSRYAAGSIQWWYYKMDKEQFPYVVSLRGKNKLVEEILQFYNYIPPDVEDALFYAKRIIHGRD
jgi:hypothetical protein